MPAGRRNRGRAVALGRLLIPIAGAGVAALALGRGRLQQLGQQAKEFSSSGAIGRQVAQPCQQMLHQHSLPHQQGSPFNTSAGSNLQV